MISKVMANYPHVAIACTGMMIFLLVFGGVLLWAFRGISRELIARAEQLPLDRNGGNQS